MRITSASRGSRKALILSVSVLALVLLLAPAATAGPLSDVTSVVPDVLEGDTQSSSDGAAPAEGGGIGIGGAVAEVVTTITESGAGAVTNVVEEVADEVDKSSTPVKEVVEKLSGTVNSTAAAATGAASAAVKTIRETTDKLVTPKSDRKHQRSSRDNAKNHATNVSKNAGSQSEVLGSTFADALRSDAETPVFVPSESVFVQPAGESLITQIGRIAAEAAQQVAFPMLLTLLVVGFLFAQNRIDRSDPKLALAPVESDHDLLSFT